MISSIIQHVMTSATEAELAALFHNARDGIPLRTALLVMGHPQAQTPIQTDNACASGIANERVKQRRFKAIDMRVYWIQDQIKQGQYLVHWRRGLLHKTPLTCTSLPHAISLFTTDT
jgi:transposase